MTIVISHDGPRKPQIAVVTGSKVPCNGCTACCQRDLIFLHPEHGDDPRNYPGNVMEAKHPLTGEQGLALKHKPNGGCVYVTDAGCSIHGKAPAICREFDCRRLAKSLLDLPRPERRRWQRMLGGQHLLSAEVFEAGKARMHTLKEDAA